MAYFRQLNFQKCLVKPLKIWFLSLQKLDGYHFYLHWKMKGYQGLPVKEIIDT
jgi:hypothetical protein